MFQYRANVTKVYDGDTITVDIDLGFGIWKKGEKIRLFQIDAPEIRGEEREKGRESRDVLRDMILGKEVMLWTVKDRQGKYGRYLGVVCRDGVNINRWMVEHGYAKDYDV